MVNKADIGMKIYRVIISEFKNSFDEYGDVFRFNEKVLHYILDVRENVEYLSNCIYIPDQILMSKIFKLDKILEKKFNSRGTIVKNGYSLVNHFILKDYVSYRDDGVMDDYETELTYAEYLIKEILCQNLFPMH